jgi:hypothetical protein
MAAQPWISTVRQIVDGEPVNAQKTNAPTSDLSSRTDYLKARMDAMESGQALILYDRPLGSDLVVGMPLYIDSSGVWQAATAAWVEEEVNTVAESGRVSGVLASLTSANLGDVLILGTLELTSAELSAISDGTVENGAVFLSDSTAGFLITTAPAPSIFIGTLSDSGTGTKLLSVLQSVRPAGDGVRDSSQLVASLTALNDSVSIVDADTLEPATTGALKISANLAATVSDDGTLDLQGTAVKGYDSTNRVLKLGAVVSGIAFSPDFTVQSSGSSNNGEEDYLNGLLHVSLASSDANRDGSAQLVALNGVTEEMYLDSVPYLAFPGERATSLRCKVVPTPFTGGGTAELTLSFWLFAPGAVPTASIDFSYLVIPKPSDEGALPTTESVVETITPTFTTAGNYNLFTVSPITISSGSVVLFTLARTDVGANALGLLNIAYNYTA